MIGWRVRSHEAQDHDESTVPSLAKPVRAWGHEWSPELQAQVTVLGHNHWFRDRNDNSDAVFIALRETPMWGGGRPDAFAPGGPIEAWIKHGTLPAKT